MIKILKHLSPDFSAVGTDCLKNKEQVEHWIGQLVDELLERLDRDKELNNRRPTLLVLSMDQANLGMVSRSTQFEYFGKERLIQILMSKILTPLLFKKDNTVTNPIRMLSVAATKFIELVEHKNTIEGFFQKMQSKRASEEAQNVNQLLAASTSGEGAEQAAAGNAENQEEAANQRSKTDFKNLNCKSMMDKYFRELEADMRPKEPPKKKLTIQNMFNKIAEQTGQDLRTRREEQLVAEGSVGDLLAGNQANSVNNPTSTVSNPASNAPKARPNPIIDLINKKNNLRCNQQPVLITLDDNQPSTSSAPQPVESFAAKQLKLIREQGLLDENELKKLEEELLGEERPRPVEKIGFFRRKTLELRGKKRKLNAR